MAGETPELPQRLKVLVVDDDRAMGHSLKLALSDDCEVSTARSAVEAQQLLSTKQFDVVLCDLLLGDDNGALLAGKIVAERPRYANHIILMTGAMPDPSWAERVKALGHHVLSKPFGRAQVLAALREAAI
jgi:DNA-binding NtrC family response regulator